MKTKLISVVVLFSICGSSRPASAQVYFPFPTDSAVWSAVVCGWGSSLERLIMSGDTTINNQTYHKIFVSVYDPLFPFDTTYYLYAIREESRKIYWSYGSNDERLLYDFNVGLNDSVEVYNAANSQPIKMKVDSVDEILINGEWHRRLKFNQGPNSLPHATEYWIEGVGSTFSLMNPLMSVYDASTSLYCLKVNGIQEYLDSVNMAYACFSGESSFSCDGFDSLFLNTKKPTSTKLYPDPAFSYIKLEFSQPAFSILLFDCIGRIISSFPPSSSLSLIINVSNVSAGIYFVEIQNEKGRQVEKFIKQ